MTNEFKNVKIRALESSLHSPVGHSDGAGPGSSQEPGASSGFTMWVTGSNLWAIFCFPQDYPWGAGLGVEQPGCELAAVMKAAIASGSFTCSATALALW